MCLFVCTYITFKKNAGILFVSHPDNETSRITSGCREITRDVCVMGWGGVEGYSLYTIGGVRYTYMQTIMQWNTLLTHSTEYTL